MKTIQATVVSNQMQKTIVVEIKKRFTHPLYKKVIWRTKRLKVHTDDEVKVGDSVEIVSTRPISKDIHFKVVNLIKKTA